MNPRVAGSGVPPVIGASVALNVTTSLAPVIAPPATLLPALVSWIVKLDKFRPLTVALGLIVTGHETLLFETFVVTLQKVGAEKTGALWVKVPK
jgi:hypothetical protein